MNTFDPIKWEYRINGLHVPSVTQVLNDLIPGWQASEWHMQRGTAVHACAAMIAKGVDFDYDPQIAGQVEACRKFFAEVKPRVHYGTEQQLFSTHNKFAGTVDLTVDLGKHGVTVLDWKASFSAALPFQLAAYGLLLDETYGCQHRHGVGVQLCADGNYKMSDVYDLRPYKSKFLALLAAYNIRRDCKVTENNTNKG